MVLLSLPWPARLSFPLFSAPHRDTPVLTRTLCSLRKMGLGRRSLSLAHGHDLGLRLVSKAEVPSHLEVNGVGGKRGGTAAQTAPTGFHVFGPRQDWLRAGQGFMPSEAARNRAGEHERVMC